MTEKMSGFGRRWKKWLWVLTSRPAPLVTLSSTWCSSTTEAAGAASDTDG